MANKKNKINELVTDDDDPTAELEALVLNKVSSGGGAEDLLESAAGTYDFVGPNNENIDQSIPDLKSDLKSRSETIARLQFDMQQLRSKWMGLETEIKAREEITDRLNKELHTSKNKLARKEKLLKKRDQSIKALKAEIRERNDAYSALEADIVGRANEIDELNEKLAVDHDEEAEHRQHLVEQQAGQIASAEITISELRSQLARNESYSDSLRQQLQDRSAVKNEAEHTREYLQNSIDRIDEQLEQTKASFEAEKAINTKLSEELEELQAAHADEIRMIRFELGEAEETVAQHELVATELASDLVDTREFRDELEQMLSKAEEDNHSQFEALEKENRELQQLVAESEEKLETKSNAINCLLAELSKKSEQIDSIGEIEQVIHEIDDRMSERIDDRTSKERDRVTRLLVGSVEGQELRFPLFKNRLTIGRTEQNDIQLKASYVSRRHAVIVTEHEATRVIDWGSKNGVYVNAKRINEHFLKNGDKVTIGTADFRYQERPKLDS